MKRPDVPPGWMLVPMEPTLAMLAAYRAALDRYPKPAKGDHRTIYLTHHEKAALRWRAMLAAAPVCEPPK